MSKHTPGPWWPERSWFGRYRVCAESALMNSSLVASGIYYESDARSIAKLPELHTVLAAMVAEATAKGIELQSLPDAARVLAKFES